MRAVPGVQLGLQAARPAGRGSSAPGHAPAPRSLPEAGGVQAGAGQGFLFDELVEIGRHLQAVMLDALRHADL